MHESGRFMPAHPVPRRRVLIVSGQGKILRVTNDCPAALGCGDERGLGALLHRIISPSALRALRRAAGRRGKQGAGSHIAALDLLGDGRIFTVSIRHRRRAFLIAIEPAGAIAAPLPRIAAGAAPVGAFSRIRCFAPRINDDQRPALRWHEAAAAAKSTGARAVSGSGGAVRDQITIAELNHRLRNILSLVHSVVEQQAVGGSAEIQAHTGALLDRVELLARSAVISPDHAAPISAEVLVRDEFAPFDTGARLRIHGQAPSLRPAARLALSLTVHELVTNSLKHGALSRIGGSITVHFATTRHGLRINWAEHGAPVPVPAPVPAQSGPAGFGLALVSRAIPEMLGGQSRIMFIGGALTASLIIPGKWIIPADRIPIPATTPGTGTTARLTGNALIVEDNLPVAISTASMMGAMGARGVSLASSVAESLALIGAAAFEIAIIDRDLGGESAAPVAAALSHAGVPFVVVSGYDAPEPDDPAFRGAPHLCKPLARDAFAHAVTTLRVRWAGPPSNPRLRPGRAAGSPSAYAEKARSNAAPQGCA